MKALWSIPLILAALPASAQERLAAQVRCVPAAKPLVYDCVLTLTGRQSNQPMPGATITVGADMPSMPMAHKVKPVNATPGDAPGTYRFTIELEMHGEWASHRNLRPPPGRDRGETGFPAQRGEVAGEQEAQRRGETGRFAQRSPRRHEEVRFTGRRGDGEIFSARSAITFPTRLPASP
jgi:hypothetical protein